MTTKCEQTEYGRFRQGSNHGRCSTGDYQQYLGELGPACCRGDLSLCPELQTFMAQGGSVSDPNIPLVVPENEMGAPVCTDDCRSYFEEFYAECNPRFATQPDLAAGLEGFLAICQGMPAPVAGGGGGGGGGH